MALKSFFLLTILVVTSKTINIDPFHQEDTTEFIHDMLDTIMVERAPGSKGHEEVYQFITNQMETYGNWEVQTDEFIKKTAAYGEVTFKNIIATLQSSPSIKHYMVLACHYDSKFIVEFLFVGASDAAVPCAMLLEMAKFLSNKYSKESTAEIGFKIMFFDGEEALHEWTEEDSLHGSRHLAEKLSVAVNGVSPLQEIDLLVLLDLIAPKNPKFWDFFDNTHLWFKQLVKIEEDLTELGFLLEHEPYFQTVKPDFSTLDDHLPFLQRGVPVLHLINMPFPKEWHTAEDNKDIVDMDTVIDIVYILKIFAWQYMSGNLTTALTHDVPAVPDITPSTIENSSTMEDFVTKSTDMVDNSMTPSVAEENYSTTPITAAT